MHDYMMGNMMDNMMGNITGFGGGGSMIILWVILIGLIIWAVTSAGRRRYADDVDYAHNQPRRSSGLDILNERYAKGEISKEEYEQKRKDILA